MAVGTRRARQADRILLIEDDQAMGADIVKGLRNENFDVCWRRDGHEGYATLLWERPRLLILERLLPGQDGATLLRRARAEGILCPALFLTDRDRAGDEVAGLRAGADDRLCRPFVVAELLARVRTLLRRYPAPLEMRCADLYVDTAIRIVKRGAMTIELTSKEYGLLEFMMRHQNQTVTRDTLAREVWKNTQRATARHNVIDVHIARVRRKLEAGERPRLVHTVRGIGFCLSDRVPW